MEMVLWGVAMKYLLLVVTLFVVFGPARGWFWRNWRFNLPAVVAGFGAWFIAEAVLKPQHPWWIAPIAAVAAALMGGAAGKDWLDNVLGKER